MFTGSTKSRHTLPSRPVSYRWRRLVLLDHENLVGLTRGDERRRQLQWFLGLLRLEPQRDRIIAGASSSHTCFEIRSELAGVGAVHLRHGADGAERAIEDNLDLRWATENHHELLIASGDHYFLEMAEVFHRYERRVTVVAGLSSLSIDLRNEADTVLTLPSLAPPPHEWLHEWPPWIN